MLTEYKITFEDGSVTISQRVTRETKDNNESQTQTETQTTAEEGHLGTTFKVTKPTTRVRGGGEASTGTTGGGAIIPGLIVVFGSLITGGRLSSLGSGEGSSGTVGGQQFRSEQDR